MATDVKLLDGRYRVLRRLGAGGMGAVFLAEDERLGRRVAVKRLHADSPEETARRFEREARLGAMLNHPNLVAVYDTFSDREDVLIVMEYVEGSTLADELLRGTMPRARALDVLRDVAAGLDHAHAQGVVHRDVKPANILLGPGGVVKLADLGIATAAEHTNITRTGTMLGSPSYMAPEQIEGRGVTSAVDVYALAAVAFEALGGRKARPGGTPLEIAHRVVSEPPPDLREAWPDAPPGLAEVLRVGMAGEPADRPASCGELVRRLGEAARAAEAEPTQPLAGPPAPVPTEWRATATRAQPPPAAAPGRAPDSPPYARQRAGRRSRAPVAFAAAAVLFLGGVAAWAAVGGLSDEPAPTRESAAPTTTTAPEPTTAQTAPEETTQPEAAPTTTTPPEPPAEEESPSGSEEEPDAARARRLNDEGYALSQAGQDEQAVPVLRRALESWPEGSEGELEYAFTLFNLAHSLRLTGNPEEAIPLLERRLEVSDNQRGAVRRELRLARAEAEEG